MIALFGLYVTSKIVITIITMIMVNKISEQIKLEIVKP